MWTDWGGGGRENWGEGRAQEKKRLANPRVSFRTMDRHLRSGELGGVHQELENQEKIEY